MEWLTKEHGALLTGKSARTIGRWMQSNANNPSRINKHGRINPEELRKDYPFLESPNLQTESDTSKVEFMGLANRQTELSAFKDQLSAQQITIDKLIDSRTRPLVILTLLFLLVVTGMTAGFYLFMESYKSEVNELHNKQLNSQSELFDVKYKAIESEHQKKAEYKNQLEELRALQDAKTINEQAKRIKNLKKEVDVLKKDINQLGDKQHLTSLKNEF